MVHKPVTDAEVRVFWERYFRSANLPFEPRDTDDAARWTLESFLVDREESPDPPWLEEAVEAAAEAYDRHPDGWHAVIRAVEHVRMAHEAASAKR